MILSKETQAAFKEAIERLEGEILQHQKDAHETMRQLHEKEQLAHDLRKQLGRMDAQDQPATTEREPFSGITLIEAARLVLRNAREPMTVAEIAKEIYRGGYRGDGKIPDANRVAANLHSYIRRKRNQPHFPLHEISKNQWISADRIDSELEELDKDLSSRDTR